MNNGVFITATDTGVGKTFAACALARAVAALGISCGVFKPVSSGGREDAAALIAASGCAETLDMVNPVALKYPLAPLIAARREKRIISLKTIRDRYRQISRAHDFTVVEGAGGVLVPIRRDYFVRDMIRDLRLPAVVVARPDLGTINHTLLSVAALIAARIEVLGIVISCARALAGDEKKTPAAIRELSGLPVAEIAPGGTLSRKDVAWMLGKKG